MLVKLYAQVKIGKLALDLEIPVFYPNPNGDGTPILLKWETTPGSEHYYEELDLTTEEKHTSAFDPAKAMLFDSQGNEGVSLIPFLQGKLPNYIKMVTI